MTSHICVLGNCFSFKTGDREAASQALFKANDQVLNSVVILMFSHCVHCLANRMTVDPPQESLQLSGSSSGTGCMSTTLSARPFGRIIIETDNNKNIHIT